MKVNEIRYIFNNLGIKELENPPIYAKENINLVGCFNGFFIFRYSYYWVVRGKMPLKYAKELYKYRDTDDIRVEGGSNDNEPIKWCTSDEHYKYKLEMFKTYEAKLIKLDEMLKKINVKKEELMKNNIEDFYISMYHIDKNEGLQRVVNIIKENNLKTEWY